MHGESVRVYVSMCLIEKYEKPFTMHYVQPAMQFIFVLSFFSPFFIWILFITENRARCRLRARYVV